MWIRAGEGVILVKNSFWCVWAYDVWYFRYGSWGRHWQYRILFGCGIWLACLRVILSDCELCLSLVEICLVERCMDG